MEKRRSVETTEMYIDETGMGRDGTEMGADGDGTDTARRREVEDTGRDDYVWNRARESGFCMDPGKRRNGDGMEMEYRGTE